MRFNLLLSIPLIERPLPELPSILVVALKMPAVSLTPLIFWIFVTRLSLILPDVDPKSLEPVCVTVISAAPALRVVCVDA